jgi:PAS domain S-box-containing protein
MNSDSSSDSRGFDDELLESAADIIILVDQETKAIRGANREAHERLGLSPGALEGREFNALVGHASEPFELSWQRIRPMGRGLIECSLRSARGGEIDVEISVSAVDSGILLVARETSTRARPDDIDANRSRKTQRTLDALDGLVVTIDPQGSIIHMNQAAQALLPLSSPLILGTNIVRAPWWDPEESTKRRLGESIAAALAGTRIRQTESLSDARGQVNDYELVFSPMYDDHGDVAGLVLQGLIRSDVIFDTASQTEGDSWEFDLDSRGALLNVNAAFAQLLREEFDVDTVEHISDFLTDKAAEVLLEQLQRLVEGELRTAEVELRGLHRPFRLIVAEHPDAWDLARAVIVAESPLANRSSGNRLERVKASLLAGVSHEIRTPMNAILGLTELALSEDLPSAAREHLGIALDSARHLMRLLDDILDVTRLERGRLHFENRPFSPRRVVRQAVRAFQPSAEQKGLSLEVDIADDIAPWLRGDEARLAQIVTNLVSNAVRYTEQGSIIARLRQLDEDGERAQLQLCVTDTGMGVDAAARKRIFRPFERDVAADAKASEGLGLGLAIARRLCERMGGELSLEDVASGGSRFIATFFCALDEESPTDQDGSEASLDLDRAPQRLRVLVVDDAHANRHLVRTLLEQRGHEVATENDGEAALARLSSERPDVVLMDVSLPGIDGLEATRRLRMKESTLASPPLPVIALTAHTMEGDREECLAAGMNAYLSKPVDAHELIMLVEDMAMRLPVESQESTRVSASRPEATSPLEEELVFDCEAALKRLGGDRALFAEMVEILADEGSQLVSTIDTAEREQARRAAHTLKSQAATVGAESLRRRAAEIEQSPSTAPAKVGGLRRVFAASLAELREQLAR